MTLYFTIGYPINNYYIIVLIFEDRIYLLEQYLIVNLIIIVTPSLWNKTSFQNYY
jgi:hypothetical protein